VRLVFLTNEEM